MIEYLGSLQLSLPGAAEQVTLRMLLSHTAGLSRDVEWWGSRDFDALEKFVGDDLPAIPMAAPASNALPPFSSIRIPAWVAR